MVKKGPGNDQPVPDPVLLAKALQSLGILSVRIPSQLDDQRPSPMPEVRAVTEKEK